MEEFPYKTISADKCLQKAIKSGYVTKVGGTIRTWKKRLMVLVKDYLIYYKNEKDSSPKGHIILSTIHSITKDKMKKKLGIVLESQSRDYQMFSDTEGETNEWYDAIKKQLPLKEEKKQVEEELVLDEPSKPKTMREILVDTKNCTFMKQEPSVFNDFWNVWRNSVPDKENLKSPVLFEVWVNPSLSRICWKACGPQAGMIQKLVDFFYVVGAPESEIERLNEVGALLNPKMIGYWIDLATPDGFDGGWFFDSECSVQLALSSLENADLASQLKTWVEKNNITHTVYVSRDVGAEPPRQTELRFKIPGVDALAQMDVALSAYDTFEFTPLPAEAIKIIQSETTNPDLFVSISVCEDEITKISVFQKNPSPRVTSQLAKVKEPSASLQSLQDTIKASGPTMIEYSVLRDGYGFSIYEEGFSTHYHYVIGEDK